jgi:TolA-binding protein
MSKILKKLVSLFFVLNFSLACFATETGAFAFVEGCKAFSEGDWENAIILLKRAVAYKEFESPDSYYMLISAEVEANENEAALYDCDFFLNSFPNSIYVSRINYLKGRLLFNLGEYDEAIVVLSDFCRLYEDDQMYSYALFYIAESLYAGYQYDDAKNIYERVINEFPESPKYAHSQYRVDLILQRAREEKLLYLLKQTGEEYLAAKEDYERQLRMYNSEALTASKDKVNELQEENVELNEKIADLEEQIKELKLQLENEQQNRNQLEESSVNFVEYDEVAEDVPSMEPYDEKKESVRRLKQKASEIKELLGE